MLARATVSGCCDAIGFLPLPRRVQFRLLLGGVGVAIDGIVTESLLNILGKFSEINFRDPQFAYEHDPIRFDSFYCDVFVFLLQWF